METTVTVRFSSIEQGQKFFWKSSEFTKTGKRNAKLNGANHHFVFNLNDIVMKEVIEEKEDSDFDIYQYFYGLANNNQPSSPNPYLQDDDDDFPVICPLYNKSYPVKDIPLH